jgi:hypothetical protein
MITSLITLTTAGSGTGPFDLYSDTDAYSSPFESGVAKASLISGYVSTLVPNGTTIIRVKSYNLGCTNYVDMPISGITTTTTTTTTLAPTTTTTTTTAPVYTNAGTITNNTASPITASTAIVRVNGHANAFVALNIPAGGTQTFDTAYSPYISGIGNAFRLDLYGSTGVSGVNTMKQSGGDSTTNTGTFTNPGGYWTATSTTTSTGSQYVIQMTIS